MCEFLAHFLIYKFLFINTLRDFKIRKISKMSSISEIKRLEMLYVYPSMLINRQVTPQLLLPFLNLFEILLNQINEIAAIFHLRSFE